MRLKLFLVLFLSLWASVASSQIAAWNFFGETSPATSAADTFNANLDSSSNITRGSGAAASTGSNSFRTVGFQNNGISVANTDYFQITLSATTGYTLSLSSIDANFLGTATYYAGAGVTSQFAYSLDGTTFTLIGSPVTSSSLAMATVDLTSVTALQNVPATTTVYLRYYASGQTSTGGWGFGSSTAGVNGLAIGGTLTSGIQSYQSGDWADPATWVGGVVPASGSSAVINSGHIVHTTDPALVRSAATIVNGTFELRAGAFPSGTNFTYGASGQLNFNTGGVYDVYGTHVYWPAASGPANVSILSGTVTLYANRTVSGNFIVGGAPTTGFYLNGASINLNGTARIDAGGFFGSAPIFGSASTLQYNPGGPYGRSAEWSHTGVGTIGTTPGYPNHVQLSNSTMFDYNNGVPNAKAMAGNLTIDTGSYFAMDFGGGASNGALTIGGNLTINGGMTLGNQNGTDDLQLYGNFVNNGTFNGNNRAVFFSKTSGTQTVSSASALVIPYVVFNATGSRTVQLLSDLTISAPATGTAISFGSASDYFDLNGRSLTVGTAAVSNTISGSGQFLGTTASTLSLQGTGNIGTVSFLTGYQNLGTLTVNRTAAAVGMNLGSALTIATALNLNNGHLDLGSNILTLNTGVAAAGSASAYIIADKTSGGILRRQIAASGTYLYPIGDRTASNNGSEYSPAQVAFPAGTYTSAYYGFQVEDSKHPNMDAATHYITRYWSGSSSGTFPSAVYTVTANYFASDVVGTETTMQSNQWNGTVWTNQGSNTGTNSLTIPSNTYPATSDFSRGWRSSDINVKQGTTTYLHNSTYNFGTQLTGATTDITFTIENLGQDLLTFSAATVSGAAYSFQTPFTLTPSVTGPTGTRTFIIRFTSATAGTFTGSVSFTTNDPYGSENPYVINFTGIVNAPAPEMDLNGATTGTNPIANGSVTTSGLNNTSFGTITLGSNVTKDFRITNSGTGALTLSGVPLVSIGGTNPGDFSVIVLPSASIAVGANTVFNINFNPTAVGTRSATVSIANNDADENPYTFLISGTADCPATGNTIYPASGPVGTEVIVTATASNLTGANATFNGVAATVTPVSSTQIKVIVPAGATTGTLMTTNSQGCTASTYFTVIDKVIGSCQGAQPPRTKLFISEVTDHGTGSHSYVEIFNATGAAVSLNGYSLRIHNNGAPTGSPTSTINLNSVSLPNNTAYVVAFGGMDATTNPGGAPQNQTSTVSGINNDDNIRLYDNTGTWIDQWGDTSGAVFTVASKDYTYRRKNAGITVPTTTWNPSDWVAFSPVNYSDVGVYDFSTGLPPVITAQPAFAPSCKGTSFTVGANEGFSGGNALAYQWYVTIPPATTWTALADGGVYSGVTTATLDISDISGLQGYQYYCQVRENGATCYTASNAVKVGAASAVTWNGSAWNPAPPTLTTTVTLNGSYDTAVSGDFQACSLTVASGTLNVATGDFVTVANDLTVNAGATMNILNSGSLVMIEDDGVVTNNGTMTIARTTTPFVKYDYTYWSSPITNATLSNSLPGWRHDYSFWFNTVNFADLTGISGSGPADGFDDDGNVWTLQGATALLNPGQGYAVMGSTTAPSYPISPTVTFSGKYNTGTVPQTVFLSDNPADNNDDFNLLGNPYPCALFADQFIVDNTAISGTLYFWTHRTPISTSAYGPSAANFITSDYAMYNLTGGVGTGTGYASANGGNAPTAYIASGQGFFVEADVSGAVNFTNAMRVTGADNSNFYRMAAPVEKDRVWLDLTHEMGLYSQALVGFLPEAGAEYDKMYDGRVSKSQNSVSLYSLIGSDAFRIQALSSFTGSEIVPLGYSANLSSGYSIAINRAEGVLSAPDQPIYLEDKLLNIFHDLKSGAYAFTSEAGTFDDRFQLRFSLPLSVPGQTDTRSFGIAGNDGTLKVFAQVGVSSVELFDTAGRLVFENRSVNAMEYQENLPQLQDSAIVYRVRLNDGKIVFGKIAF